MRGGRGPHVTLITALLSSQLQPRRSNQMTWKHLCNVQDLLWPCCCDLFMYRMLHIRLFCILRMFFLTSTLWSLAHNLIFLSSTRELLVHPQNLIFSQQNQILTNTKLPILVKMAGGAKKNTAAKALIFPANGGWLETTHFVFTDWILSRPVHALCFCATGMRPSRC